MNISIPKLSYVNSREFLYKFQLVESSSYMDWYDCEVENANYIWLINDMVNPLGFLSYKTLVLPNQIGFVYIVKIYVLNQYRGRNPLLLEGERASEILLREIERKGFDILTLESACDALDKRYKVLGFKYIEDLSREFGSVIGTSEKILHKPINIEKDTSGERINISAT